MNEAKKSAKEHTKTWAKKQDEKTGKTLKKAATRTCDKEQHKYEKVKYQVRKRLGLATEADHKALLKRDYKEKKWALDKISALEGKKKQVHEASSKKVSKAKETEKKKEKAAEMKTKAKLRAQKERKDKFASSAKIKEKKAKSMVTSAAAKRKAKIAAAMKLKVIAQKEYDAQVKVAHKTLREATTTLTRTSKVEIRKLGTRKTKALGALSKAGNVNLKPDYERLAQKGKEQKAKALQKSKERIQKATKKKDDLLGKQVFDRKQLKSRLKLELESAKSEADKITTRAKLVLTKKKQDAKNILAEALKGESGAKQAAVMQAQLKADKLLRESKDALGNAMKAARKLFIEQVKKATAKYLKEVKSHKTKGIAGLSEATAFIQVDEENDDVSEARAWSWRYLQASYHRFGVY